MNSQGFLERRLTTSNGAGAAVTTGLGQPRLRSELDHANSSEHHLQDAKESYQSNLTSFDNRVYQHMLAGPLKQTMESTAPSGSTQLQSFGQVLQNASLLFPPQYDNMSTLQHNSGAGQVFPESQLSEMKMLAMNQMQLAAPTLTDDASKLSTIQGVEYTQLAVGARKQGHLPEPLQPTFADPMSMLSSQHMLYMSNEQALSKQEPTILSDTLNQRLTDMTPFSSNLEASKNTPSICEIHREGVSPHSQAMRQPLVQPMEVAVAHEHIGVAQQKPPIQSHHRSQSREKSPLFRMKELRRRSPSKGKTK